jgi:hypothetical protein
MYPYSGSTITPIADAELIPDESEGYIDIYMRLSAGALYHYTSQASFLAILEHESIRATDIRFLNDAQEFEHARSVALRVIREVATTSEAAEMAFIESLRVDGIHSLGLVPTAFIFSLTEHRDDLSQWRAYCPADGFAMGFEVRRLITAATKKGFRLERCIYDELEQKAVIRDLVTKALQEYRNLSSRPQAAERFADAFLAVAPVLKHPSFDAEKEWRLVSTPQRYSEPEHVGMQLREGRTVPVPYVEIPLALDHMDVRALDQQLSASPVLWPIPEVIVGPSTNPELSYISASVALLRKCPIQDIIEVRRSDIPYRNWV